MPEEERSTNHVVSSHWFGGKDLLPPDIVYIGRPSSWGNRWMTSSGTLSQEDTVALHRIDLYTELTKDPFYLEKIRQELDGHDLACWCKQKHTLVACHGDNYLHILSPLRKYRPYDKSISFYLIDDLRIVFAALDDRVGKHIPQEDFLPVFIHLGDVKVDTNEIIGWLKRQSFDLRTVHVFLARLAVELELALGEQDLGMMEYRFNYACWHIDRLRRPLVSISHPPRRPDVPLANPTFTTQLTP